MGARTISAIAFKVLAILLLVELVMSAPALSRLAIMTMDGSAGLILLLIGVIAIVGLVACFLLFRFSNSILKALPEGSSDERAASSHTLIIQLVGLFFVVSPISEIPLSLNEIVKLAFFQTSYGMPAALPYVLHLGGLVLQLFLGVAMLIGSQKVHRWLLKIRGRA
ncbi:MAG: hypothetical protein ACPGPF_01215 [Pontibacterium sp.]